MGKIHESSVSKLKQMRIWGKGATNAHTVRMFFFGGHRRTFLWWWNSSDEFRDCPGHWSGSVEGKQRYSGGYKWNFHRQWEDLHLENDFIGIVMGRSVVDVLCFSMCSVLRESSVFFFVEMWRCVWLSRQFVSINHLLFYVHNLSILPFQKLCDDKKICIFARGKVTLVKNWSFWWCFRNGEMWFEHSIGVVKRCWWTRIEEKFQWNLMGSSVISICLFVNRFNWRREQWEWIRCQTLQTITTENPLHNLQHYKLHKDFSWKISSSKQIFLGKKFSSFNETSTCTNTTADSQFAPKRILFFKQHNSAHHSIKITNYFTRIFSPTTIKIEQETRLRHQQWNSLSHRKLIDKNTTLLNTK